MSNLYLISSFPPTCRPAVVLVIPSITKKGFEIYCASKEARKGKEKEKERKGGREGEKERERKEGRKERKRKGGRKGRKGGKAGFCS